MKLSGEPMVHLFASTSGTDSDWVVKIIDVYPEGDAPGGDAGGAFTGVLGKETDMRGYELPIGTDIFRGRYRTSFEKPAALKSNEALEFTFGLPMIDRTNSGGAPDHGSGAVDAVPAVRSQSADVCAEYFRCEAGRLRKGDAARLAYAGRGELYQLAGGEITATALCSCA